MNGTLLDLFGVIAASTGLLDAMVSGALAFLLHRAVVSSALAILPSGTTFSSTFAFLPSAACGICANHPVGRFPIRNDVKECIMSTNKEPKGGETTP